MKRIVWGLLASASFLFSAGCWDLKATSNLEYDELNDQITFSIKDAMDCKSVAGATVQFGSVELKADALGEFHVPLDALEEEQKIILNVSKAGYIPLVKQLEVEAGTIRGNKILLSPKLAPTSVRFVLSWSDQPKDMDIHLISSGYHISFHDTKNVRDKAKLDRDATQGFGPETITLEEVKESEKYTLYVDRFSRDGEIDSDAEVQVYIDNRLDKVVKLPKTSERAVKVMSLYQGEEHYYNKPINNIP